jgi:hypothetical protein
LSCNGLLGAWRDHFSDDRAKPFGSKIDRNPDVPSTLGDVGDKFLSVEERDSINKGAAHLTEKLTLDPDSEVDLINILERSTPVLSRLVEALRKSDEKEEATQWLDRTDELIERMKTLQAKKAAEDSAA